MFDEYELVFDETEMLVGGGLLAIGFLALFIIKVWSERDSGGGPSSDEALASSDDPLPGQDPGSDPYDDPFPGVEDEPEGEPETETERLARIERELAEREAKSKAEKVSELEERAKIIHKKESETDAPDPPSPDIARLSEEKKQIEGLIKKAEARFDSGELEEKNFKMILLDYQNQIVDLDIKLRKARKGGG